MASILTTIAATLALLLPIPAIHAATPAQVELGKVEGWTGPPVSVTGDYLISAFCFCAVPDPDPDSSSYSEAHYFQFEYFNWHNNMTYILDHLCLEDSDAWTTCLAPLPGDEIGVDWKGPLCRTWWNTMDTESKYHDRDVLCYEPRRHDDDWHRYKIPGADTIRFNGQKRRLDKKGRQGPVLLSKAESEDECGRLCDEHAGMGVLRDDERSQCHVVHYTGLDDMCMDCA